MSFLAQGGGSPPFEYPSPSAACFEGALDGQSGAQGGGGWSVGGEDGVGGEGGGGPEVLKEGQSPIRFQPSPAALSLPCAPPCARSPPPSLPSPSPLPPSTLAPGAQRDSLRGIGSIGSEINDRCGTT
jgi:hypothetical protein